MIELLRAFEWVSTTLNADPTVTAGVAGRIFSNSAAEQAPYPLIVLSATRSRTVLTFATSRILVDLTLLVEVITRDDSLDVIGPIADAVDAALNGQTGTTTDGRVLTCYQLQQVSRETIEEGVTYRHVGGLYRLLVQPQ